MQPVWDSENSENIKGTADTSEIEGSALYGAPDLQRRWCQDFEEAFESSLNRRMKRMQSQLDQVIEAAVAAGVAATTAAADSQEEKVAARATAAAATATTTIAKTSETEQKTPTATARQLARATKKALKVASSCAKPTKKVYGPTQRQVRLPDPPENFQDPVMEIDTLSETFSNFDRLISKRKMQLSSLRSQFEEARKTEEDAEQACKAAERKHDLALEPGGPAKLFQERLERKRAETEETRQMLASKRAEAIRLKSLCREQRRYLIQCDRIVDFGGRSVVDNNRCGDIAMAVAPPQLDATSPPETYDIGCAHANPYITDSWPMEPNVLASRSPTEGTMEPLKEETPEAEEAERWRLPHRCVGPHISMLPEDDDESEESVDDRQHNSPPCTSRSL